MEIENFHLKYNKLTEDLVNKKITLFDATTKLYEIIWELLFVLVKQWQVMIEKEQKAVKCCPVCGKRVYTHKITHPLFIFSFGRIDFFSRRIRCKHCGYYENLLKRWIPAGIENRITPMVGEKLIWLSSLMPYKEVQFHLQQFWGLAISVTGIKNYVEKMSIKISSKTNLVTADLREYKMLWDKVYIYVDGVMTFIDNKWQEVKTGIIECHKNGKIVYFYHSEKTTWKSFLKNMKKISIKLGCESAKNKLFISDAGKGITGNIFKIFIDYTYLIDYFHATQHIAIFLNGLKSKPKELIDGWRKELISLLYKGQIKELVNQMYAMKGKKPTREMYREINYFKKHSSYFNYPLFRQHKWHIGSGKIESACRWLIQQRFKLSGMRWKQHGFNTILCLRLALYNNKLFPAFRAITKGA